MRQHKLLWASSYDRGLNVLLKMWPAIRKHFPDAELHCCYGWNLFDTITANNPERAEWKAKMVELMKQPGIIHHGRIGKDEVKKLMQECGILAYPSDFTEIFCINVVDAQFHGCVPITTDIAALKETNQGGILVHGDIYDHEVQEDYLKQLLRLMTNETEWQNCQSRGRIFAEAFLWKKIAEQWDTVFTLPAPEPTVSIITPTIRRGWWNIMAHNIATQTYKNIEWVIVDDFPTNRQHIAEEYARRYKLTIKYVRGKPHATRRTYGLVNANNTGMQNSTGELLVILQDFILMPSTGIEQLVNIYLKYPTALIAPVDTYYAPKYKPNTKSEDWFEGKLDVQGEFMRSNARINNTGFRESNLPYEYEQNYGAVPRAVAEALGGWFEFFDEGLGFDNTEFAYRALKAGFKILVDEDNVGICIDHWETLKGTPEHGLGRERRLNDPRFMFLKQMVDQKKLPLRRTQELDDKIELLYEMPEDLGQDDAVVWIRKNMAAICYDWIEKYKEIL